MEHLPSAITLKADYGTGCKASDGSTMSGSVTLAITGLTMTETALNLNFALTPTNLKRNGTVTTTFTDTIFSTGSAGIFAYGVDTLMKADNCSGGNLSAGASVNFFGKRRL